MALSDPPGSAGPSSRFRHAQGAVLHRDTHITNLRGLSLTTPGESDGFCANHQRVALPLLSAGGQIAILEVRQWEEALSATAVPGTWVPAPAMHPG